MKATAETYRQRASELEQRGGGASGAGMDALENAARAAWAIAVKEAQLNEAAEAARRLREAAAKASQDLASQEAAYQQEIAEVKEAAAQSKKAAAKAAQQLEAKEAQFKRVRGLKGASGAAGSRAHRGRAPLGASPLFPVFSCVNVPTSSSAGSGGGQGPGLDREGQGRERRQSRRRGARRPPQNAPRYGGGLCLPHSLARAPDPADALTLYTQGASSGALSADAFAFAEDAARAAWDAAEKEVKLQAATSALREAAVKAQEALRAQEAAFQDELAAERARAAAAEAEAAKALQALAAKEAEFARALSEERARAEEALRETGRKAQEELEAKGAKFQLARGPGRCPHVLCSTSLLRDVTPAMSRSLSWSRGLRSSRLSSLVPCRRSSPPRAWRPPPPRRRRAARRPSSPRWRAPRAPRGRSPGRRRSCGRRCACSGG